MRGLRGSTRMTSVGCGIRVPQRPKTCQCHRQSDIQCVLTVMAFFDPGKLELCLAITLRIRGVSTWPGTDGVTA